MTPKQLITNLCELYQQILIIDALGERAEELESAHKGKDSPNNDYIEIAYEYKAQQEQFYFKCRETIQSFVTTTVLKKTPKK
jgi:hypothetical protein